MILVLITIIFIAHLINFFFEVHNSSDSHYFYHPHKKYTHFYPLLLIAKNILITIFIFLKPSLGQLSPIICVSFSVVYIIAMLISKPFKYLLDYFRFGCIETTLTFFFVYQLLQNQKVIDVT